jgi:hypothetical protein
MEAAVARRRGEEEKRRRGEEAVGPSGGHGRDDHGSATVTESQGRTDGEEHP